jgi:hypothetical protein
MTIRGRSTLLFVLMTIALSSCAKDSYQVTLWNKRDSVIQEAAVHIEGRSIRLGTVLSKSEKGFFPVEIDLPDSIAVAWGEEDGEHWTEEVDLRGLIDRRRGAFRGELHVVVNPDGSVSVIPFREEGADVQTRRFLLSKALSEAASGKDLVPRAPV